MGGADAVSEKGVDAVRVRVVGAGVGDGSLGSGRRAAEGAAESASEETLLLGLSLRLTEGGCGGRRLSEESSCRRCRLSEESSSESRARLRLSERSGSGATEEPTASSGRSARAEDCSRIENVSSSKRGGQLEANSRPVVA